MSLIKTNPDFEYAYFDDDAQEIFMKRECIFPGAYEAWRRYRYPQSRKDLFAVCILYMEGGFVFDVELGSKQPIRNLVHPSDTFVVIGPGMGQAAVFAGAAGHPVFLQAALRFISMSLNDMPIGDLGYPGEDGPQFSLWSYTTIGWCVAVAEGVGVPITWAADGRLSNKHSCMSLYEDVKAILKKKRTNFRLVFLYNMFDIRYEQHNWKEVQKEDSGRNKGDFIIFPASRSEKTIIVSDSGAPDPVQFSSVWEPGYSPAFVPVLKIDAHASDLDVIHSSGEIIGRLDRILVHMQDLITARPRRSYAGQPLKRELVDVMRGKGFALERCWTIDPSTTAEKCVFAQIEKSLDTRDDCFKDFASGEEWADFRTSLHEMFSDDSPLAPSTVEGNEAKFSLQDKTFNLAMTLENICCIPKYVDMIVDTNSRTMLETQLPDLPCFDEEFTEELCCPDSYLLRGGLVESAVIEAFFGNLTGRIDLRRPLLYFGW
jgi:hypothetical protein